MIVEVEGELLHDFPHVVRVVSTWLWLLEGYVPSHRAAAFRRLTTRLHTCVSVWVCRCGWVGVGGSVCRCGWVGLSVWVGVGGPMWVDVGRCGSMWVDVGRCGSIRVGRSVG